MELEEGALGAAPTVRGHESAATPAYAYTYGRYFLDLYLVEGLRP